MSYRLDLSFKNCEKKDIYKNINELQQLLLKNAEEYIKQSLVYIRIDDTKDRWYNVDKIDNGAFSYCFNLKLFTSNVSISVPSPSLSVPSPDQLFPNHPKNLSKVISVLSPAISAK